MDKDLMKAIREAAKGTSCGTVIMSESEYQRLMMQLSALYERSRKANRELQQQLEDVKSLVIVMERFIYESLETFEAMFESDEGCFPYERMAEYVLAARFMGAHKHRKHIADRVEERMRDLPWGN